eukprot:TRINITY_DN1221_c0_g1_i1.p1 TRINITY_DN1221_c0_g1~~TRINITY_DN1221_c0_g1_i1.p1  ORF type:complete len:366 (+),score=105.14 TRINITY_DN1221_c0_g1_i1:116-1213(+)
MARPKGRDPLNAVLAVFGVVVLIWIYTVFFTAHALRGTLLLVGLVALVYKLTHLKRKGPSGFGARHTADEVSEGHDLTGQVAIVTGPSSGIGLETAHSLALRGAHVVMAARDEAKTKEVIRGLEARLKAKGVNGKFSFIPLDLSSLQSVRDFAKQYLAAHGNKLNLLICNAGVMALRERRSTADGFEMQVGTCHLGHYLLGNLLVDALKASAPSRVVAVSSLANRRFDTDFLDNDKLETVPYDPWTAYGNAKASNIFFANEFNRRYQAAGVTAYSLHPGGIFTGLQKEVDPVLMLKWNIALPFLGKDVEQGASTTIFCALDKQAVPGAYHEDCNVSKPAEHVKPLIEDPEAMKKFWDVSAKLVKL